MATKTFLGKLCIYEHEYKNTGKSIRYKSDKGCVVCKHNRIIKKYSENKEEISANAKLWYQNNKERESKKHNGYNDSHKVEIAIQKMGYRKKNKKILSEKHKQIYIDNREMILERSKEYRLANIEKCAITSHNYYLNNKDKIRDYQRDWAREQRKNNPKYRVNSSISSSIRKSILGNKSGRRWEILVGYTINELILHIESLFTDGMNWDNYGKGGWEIDHEIPISVFNFTHPEDIDFKRCWALDNLQPLWKLDNMRKHNKIEKDFQPSLAL